LNPANLDREKLLSLIQQYGSPLMKELTRGKALDRKDEIAAVGPLPDDVDDFWRAHVKRPEEIREVFTENFYFGCESEDPLNAMAFNSKTNAFGARLKILLGSDIGHFDVLDMTEVLEEAYELVEHGILSEAEL